MKRSLLALSVILIFCIASASFAYAGQYTLNLQTDQTVYSLGNNVTIFGDIIFNDTQVNGLVGVQVDHSGTQVLFRTLYTGTAPPPPAGDINGDGIVDILDVVIVASAYGSVPGNPNWNSAADLNADGVVDIIDIVIVAADYGQTGWGRLFEIQLQSVYLTDLFNNVVNQVKNGTQYRVYVQFKNTQVFPIQVRPAFTIYDSNNVPIYAFSAASMAALPGISIVVGQWVVPADAQLGPATVYASVYSDYPSLGGYPFSPEKSKTFSIVSSLGLMSSQTTGQSIQQTPGTFETSFHIPNISSWTGTYSIFGASIYEAGANTHFYFNSTSIQVNP